jgi:hypothetical protein
MPRNQLVTDIRAALEGEQETETTGNYGSVSVGTSPVEVIASSPPRASLLVQNVSADTAAYVGFDSNVDTTTGTLVPAQGGTYADETHTGPIYVIAEGAGTDIRFQEIVR